MPHDLYKKGRFTYLSIDNDEFKMASKKEGQRLFDKLTGNTENVAKPKKKAPSILKVSKDVEAMAAYMTRGFHDWTFKDRPNLYLEPGFRSLVGNTNRKITVAYHHLRDDWEDDCQRALAIWSEVGFSFLSMDDYETADIVVDDEKKGAYALRRFKYSGRRNGKQYVIHAADTREINIWKEWPEWDMFDAIIHEIGHVLGLGHPGPYNGTRPDTPMFKCDTSENTIMSYYGPNVGKLGP